MEFFNDAIELFNIFKFLMIIQLFVIFEIISLAQRLHVKSTENFKAIKIENKILLIERRIVMYYIDLPIYAQILWIIMGLLVLLPWIAIPAIAMYKFIQVRRLPKVSTVNANLGVDTVTNNLGLTLADGGESIDENKKK